MNRRPTNVHPGSFRALIAALLFCGVTFAFGLSAAPQLHDSLHHDHRAATHQCAATLLSSGSWEHSAPEPAITAPQPAPVTFSFLKPGHRVIAQAKSSILEHAPPALS